MKKIEMRPNRTFLNWINSYYIRWRFLLLRSCFKFAHKKQSFKIIIFRNTAEYIINCLFYIFFLCVWCVFSLFFSGGAGFLFSLFLTAKRQYCARLQLSFVWFCCSTHSNYNSLLSFRVSVWLLTYLFGSCYFVV